MSEGWLDGSYVGEVSVVVQNGCLKPNRNGGYEQVVDLPALEASGGERGLQSARDAKVVRLDIDNRETCEAQRLGGPCRRHWPPSTESLAMPLGEARATSDGRPRPAVSARVAGW